MVHAPTESEWSEVVFFVNDDLPTRGERDEIIKHLISCGARECPPPHKTAESSDHRFDVQAVTVVVARTLNFPEYPEIAAFNKKVKPGNGQERNETKWVVTTEWLTRMEKCAKWQHPRFFSPDPKKFFSGVCVCVSDEMADGDRDAITSAVTAFGGQAKNILTTEVTHLLCPRAEGTMYATGIGNVSSSFHVLLPHWFDECCRLGVPVDTQPFAWPKPPILARDGNPRDMLASNIPPKIKAILAANARSDRDSPAHLENEILLGKRVVFSRSLEMEGGRLEGLKAMVRRSAGEVLESKSEDRLIGEGGEGDVLITKWRAGKAYYAAVRARKTIATVAWLYYICTANEWVDPRDHLLHYPIPDKSIPEFEQYQMTVTNYTGETREYIKKLIDLMGGQFTADMGKQNTHVIAASDWGPKVAKAKTKGRVLVNHHWVEACFVNWKVVEPTVERLYAVDAHGLSAQSLVAKRGLADSDLVDWTDAAWEQPEVEDQDAMEVDEELVAEQEDRIVLTGASGKERGDVEMALDGDSDQDEDDKADVPMAAPVDEILDDKTVGAAEERKKMSASQSRSSSSLLTSQPPPKSAVRASSSTSALVNGNGSSKVIKAPLLSSSKPSSVTLAGPSSSGAAPVVDAVSHEPSSTPQSDVGDLPDPALLARSKSVSTNAHASSSKSVAATKKSHPPPANPATPRASSAQPRGIDPSAVLSGRPRRKAAEEADQTLHAAMEDMNAYEKSKRNGTLMTGPRRKSGANEDGRAGGSSSPARAEKRRKTSPTKEEDESDDEEEKPVPSTSKGKGAATATARVKKEDDHGAASSPSKSAKAKSIPVKTTAWLLTTKLKKDLDTADLSLLKTLGVKVVDPAKNASEAARCTHLVTSEISRTEKFLVALAAGAVIRNEKWLHASIKARRLLEADPQYELKDTDGEKKFGISLAEVLDRSARNHSNGGLLVGKWFCWTKGVKGDADQIKRLVEASGGTFNAGLPNGAAVMTESPKDNFLISDATDKKAWKPLKQAGVKVYDRELLLTGLLHQKLEPSKFLLDA